MGLNLNSFTKIFLWLLSGSFLLFITRGQCQSGFTAINSTDKLDSLLIDDAMLNFLNKEGLYPEGYLHETFLSKGLNRFLGSGKNDQGWTRPKALLSLDTYYSGRDTTYPVAYTSFSNLSASTTINLAGIPIGFRGNLIAVDGRIDPQLSTGAIQFNALQYQEKLQKKYTAASTFTDLFDPHLNPMKLSETELSSLKKEVQYAFYRNILAHPQYLERKYELEQKLDSVRLNTPNDSLICEGIRGDLAVLDTIEKRYLELNEYKKEYPYSSWLELKAKTNRLSETLDSLNNPNTFKKFLLSNDSLSLLRKVLLITKHFDLGLFSLEGSDFTIRHQPLSGLRYQMEWEPVFGEIAYGNKSFRGDFFPTVSAPFLNRAYGRRFLYSRLGLGSRDDNYFQFSALHIHDVVNTPDSLFHLPQNNLVFALEGQALLSPGLSLQMELASSQHQFSNYVGETSAESRQLFSDRSAASLKLALKTKKNQLRLAAGYFRVGPRFVTLGNPFLLTGRQGFSFDIRGRLFKNRLIVRTETKLNFSLEDQSISNTEFTEWQFLGEIRFRIGQRHFLSGQVMPNIYRQINEGNTSDGFQSTLYALQAHFNHEFDQFQLVSVGSWTNFRTAFELPDSSRFNGHHYLNLQEILTWNEKQSIQMIALLGSKDLFSSSITDLLVQLDYGQQLSRFGFRIGGQLSKVNFRGDLMAGITTQMNVKIFKRYALNFGATYRKTLEPEKVLFPEQFFGNIGISISI